MYFNVLFAPCEGGMSINKSQKGYIGKKSKDILPDIRHCVYWVLAEIWSPDSSHMIFDKKFIHHCQGWKEGSFVCETVWSFS